MLHINTIKLSMNEYAITTNAIVSVLSFELTTEQVKGESMGKIFLFILSCFSGSIDLENMFWFKKELIHR